MANPKTILNDQEYSNFRNIRAIAVLYIILGAIFLLGGLALASGTVSDPNHKDAMDNPVFGYAMAVVGLCGVVGGIGTLTGNRKIAPAAYGMAAVYLFAFLLGTILSVVLLKGLKQYLRATEKVHSARARTPKPAVE